MKTLLNGMKCAVFAAWAMGFALGARAGSGAVEYLEPVYKTAGVPATADASAAPFEAVASVNHNGVTKLYGTIETAWTAVTNLGTKTTPATLTLLTNVTVTAKLIGPANDDFSAIFDLNDKVITFIEGDGARIVHQHGKLSVVDNAANKTTKYFEPDETAYGRWVRTDAVTERFVQGGYFTGYAWLLMLEGGDVEVRDVSFVGAKRNPVYTQSVTDLTYGKCTFSRVNFLGNVCEDSFGANPGAVNLACKEFQYVFEDCVFRENVSPRGGGAIGRVANGEFPAVVLESPPRLVRCVFENNRSLEADGGAVLLEANLRKGQAGAVAYVHPMIFEDCAFGGNEAGGNGGAIAAYCNAHIMLKNCVVTNNVAGGNGGGICMDGDELQQGSVPNDKFVLINTTITGNRAGANGGGFYFAKVKTCFAAGTKVTMADGTERAIEEVVEGDVVRTFDHEGGKMSSARVYLAFKGETKDVPFTLEFDAARTESTPCQLSIVGRHDLLLKDTRKYVTISAANAHQYIGAEFYGADGAWHTLTGVTRGTQAVDYYSLYTAQHQNVYANGLLTAPDDVDYLLNIYELDENLKADAAQLAADIAQYGLADFDETAAQYGISRAWFDDAGTKYYPVAIGKGLATLEGLEALFAASTGGLPGGQPLPTSSLPKLTTASVSNADPFADYGVGHLTLGANVVIKDNTTGDGPNNLYLNYPKNETAGISRIVLLSDHTGLCVGVTTVQTPTKNTDVPFTTPCAKAGDVDNFTSDKGYSVIIDDGTLYLNVNPAPVKYLEPVYNTAGDPKSGIDHWVTDSVSEYTVVASSASQVVWGSDGATSWYVVKDGDFQIDGGVICAGHVNLILCEGAKLVVTNGTMAQAGIATDAYGSFTVYGQPNGAGALESTGAWGGAGIGGGVNGAGKNITINGGAVTTSGGNFAAGIGGGMAGVGSDIAINGGTVTAVGGIKGAGIGGGGQNSGANITINGGIVSAISTTILSWGYVVGGSGIGGGIQGYGKDITINGGTVKAVGSVNASGIGGGTAGVGQNIAIGAAKVFVSGTALRSEGSDFYPHVIGNGGACSGTAEGNVISDEAEVFFDLTPFYDKDAKQWIEEPAPMPEDFEDFVIMTPETQAVNRVLVGGLSTSQPLNFSTFSLTNAITGATGTIAVDGASVVFAERLLELPLADGMLTLTAKEFSMINPPTEVANTTAKVYTNGAEAVVGDGLPVTNGTPAYVVYAAANGYCFADRSTAKTNALDTTKNPATADVPEAPFVPVASVTTNGVTTVYSTLAGAWADATTLVKDVDVLVTLLKDAMVDATLVRSSSGKSLTLDLNDKVLAYAGANDAEIIRQAGGTAMHVIDTATERTPRYFTCDAATGLWTLTNEVTDHVVSGGLLTGGRASALYVTFGGASISNVNFVGNSSAGSGGAVSVSMYSLSVAESAFFGNVSGENGGAISAAGACEMSDCRVESNVAGELGGGVYMRLSGSLVRTSVVGNTAGTGGGVYLIFSPSCFPAGVKILMADGAEKNVEDIVEGDVVATFDHVGGTNSSAAVFYVYSGTGSSDAFTLTFASGATLDIVDRHDLLVETTRKYVTVSSDNARAFVGQRFYNYTTGGWDELVGVTPAKGGGAHYSIYVAGHANCVANGFLTVPDDKDCFVNVYELDANLKADAGQLAADIATYGLATPADYPNVPLDDFVDGNIRFARIAIGKGLTTQERILYWNEFDYGPVIAKKAKGALKLTTSSVAAATLSEPYLKVGEGTVVTGNVTTAGDLSNVYLKSKDDKDPVIHILPDTENLDVGVTLSKGTGVFGFENDVNYAASFTSDNPEYAVVYTADKTLALRVGVQVGDNARAVVEDGVCMIYGTGSTWEGKQNPLDAASITNVVIADGVTGIGSRFFKKFYKLNGVSGGKDLATVGTNAFYLCMSLENIVLDCTAVPEGLSDAIVFQTAIKPSGEAYLIPAISIKDYSQVLYGKKALDDDEWTNLGSPEDRSIYETDGYHFFQIRLVK